MEAQVSSPNFRILLVDDNELDMDLSLLVFKRLDPSLELLSFPHGRMVVEYLDKNPGHVDNSLMILDLNMPVMDGYDVLEHVQKSSLRKFPIVVLSSSSLDEEIERAFQLGAVGFHEKPYGYLETIDLFKFFISKYLTVKV